MAKCAYCGNDVGAGVKYCPSCGAAQPAAGASQTSSYQQPSYQQPIYQPSQQAYNPMQPNVNDSGSIGWGILGFLFPIVGLILFLVWRNTKPNCSRVAGIGALVGFLLGVLGNYVMWPTTSRFFGALF